MYNFCFVFLFLSFVTCFWFVILTILVYNKWLMLVRSSHALSPRKTKPNTNRICIGERGWEEKRETKRLHVEMLRTRATNNRKLGARSSGIIKLFVCLFFSIPSSFIAKPPIILHSICDFIRYFFFLFVLCFFCNTMMHKGDCLI